MRKKKTLMMYRACIIKRPREIWQYLADFSIKKNNILTVFECFSTFRDYCLLPEKQMQSHCSFKHTFEEKTFLSLLMQYLHLIIFYQRHHHRLELCSFYILQPRYLQRYADAVSRKGAPLYNCFDFLCGTIARICGPVLNERVV